jgi:hypothetical protein
MSIDYAARAAEARRRLVADEYRRASEIRTHSDAIDALGTAAAKVGVPKHALVHSYFAGEDVRLVELPGAPPTYRLAKAGEQIEGAVAETSLAELVGKRIERLAITRAYWISRAKQSRDLPHADPEVLALDVATATATVATLEASLDEQVPAITLARVDKMKVDPALRRRIADALKKNDEAFLQTILVDKRIVTGPTGDPVEIWAVAPWDPDTNPRITDDEELLRQRRRQMTFAQFRDQVRSMEILSLRFGDAADRSQLAVDHS